LVSSAVEDSVNSRPPEPYKGKGIKYFEEKLKRKVGKTGAS
jgi:large subunit ribosomal protein L6